MRMVLLLTRRVIHAEDSASVMTELVVAAAITVSPVSTASHPQDACVRTVV